MFVALMKNVAMILRFFRILLGRVVSFVVLALGVSLGWRMDCGNYRSIQHSRRVPGRHTVRWRLLFVDQNKIKGKRKDSRNTHRDVKYPFFPYFAETARIWPPFTRGRAHVTSLGNWKLPGRTFDVVIPTRLDWVK